MKRNLAITASNSIPRCSRTTPSGRRCRSSASGPDSQFCSRHLPAEDPAAELVHGLDQFRSASDVTVFLSRLISALSRDQISTRRAAVLSYVSISLMHALRTLQKENEAHPSDSQFDPLPLTWNIPRHGSPRFVNIHDARAFYAYQHARKFRQKAEESFAEVGLKSHFYPYEDGCTLRAALPDETPMSEEAAIQAFNRMKT
jgi:hypothetical protein